MPDIDRKNQSSIPIVERSESYGKDTLSAETLIAEENVSNYVKTLLLKNKEELSLFSDFGNPNINYIQLRKMLEIAKLIGFNEKQSEIDPLKLNSIEIIKLKRSLKKSIEKYQKGLFDLEDNWDGHGSKPYKMETWSKTEKLFEKLFLKLNSDGIYPQIPLILPVPDGSFDLNWQNENFELLVNIPVSDTDLINIYGERIDHPEDEIEVKINYNLAEMVLFHWLKKILQNGK